jgi:hypothetical protein
LEISGHADKAAGRHYNPELSKRLADTVREVLINLGADPKRLGLKIVGETKPFFQNYRWCAIAAKSASRDKGTWLSQEHHPRIRVR